MEEVFVDTGAWVALADTADLHHRRAVSLFPQLLRQRGRLVTSNLVVAEAYYLIRRNLGLPRALSFLESLAASPRIEKVCSTDEMEREAEKTLRHYSDQDFSFADAVSFALMKHRNTRTAFAFDRHFQAAGFEVVPPVL